MSLALLLTAYVAGIVTRIEEAYIKEVTLPVALFFITALTFCSAIV